MYSSVLVGITHIPRIIKRSKHIISVLLVILKKLNVSKIMWKIIYYI